MIRLFALFGLLSLMAIPQARAEFSVANVRDALAQEDFRALEADFQSAYEQALKDRDFAKLRHVYAVLFVTANNTRMHRNQKWLKQYPDSPFAATGLAWSHYYRAYQIRGEHHLFATRPELQSRFLKELAQVKLYSDLALENAPTFLPSVDAAILLRGTDFYREDVKPLVDLALTVAPDRHALEIGLDALSSRGPGNLMSNISLCANLAEWVPTYDAELCFIEVAFKNNVTGPMRKAAVAALADRTEPFLDYARLDAYLHEWRDQDEAPDEAKRIHRATLGPLTYIAGYLDDLAHIERYFNMSLYEVEGRDQLLLKMEERLSDNPESYGILTLLIEDILDRNARRDPTADVSKAKEYWLTTLDLGAYRPETWTLGKDVLGRLDPDIYPERDIKLLSNAIYYSSHAPSSIRYLINSLHNRYSVAIGEYSAPEAEFEPQALLDQVKCPMFRAAKVYRFICERVPDDPGCNIGGWQADLPDRLIRMAKTDQQCAWVNLADPENLLYQPVPVEHFQEGF